VNRFQARQPLTIKLPDTHVCEILGDNNEAQAFDVREVVTLIKKPQGGLEIVLTGNVIIRVQHPGTMYDIILGMMMRAGKLEE
jgi:hypothetical protein